MAGSALAIPPPATAAVPSMPLSGAAGALAAAAGVPRGQMENADGDDPLGRKRKKVPPIRSHPLPSEEGRT